MGPGAVQRVVVCPTGAAAPEAGGADSQHQWPYETCTVEHPRTGGANWCLSSWDLGRSKVLHVPAGENVAWLSRAGTLLEVNAHRPSHAAWFAGDSVLAGACMPSCLPGSTSKHGKAHSLQMAPCTCARPSTPCSWYCPFWTAGSRQAPPLSALLSIPATSCGHQAGRVQGSQPGEGMFCSAEDLMQVTLLPVLAIPGPEVAADACRAAGLQPSPQRSTGQRPRATPAMPL